MALASFSLFTDLVWLQLLCVFLTGIQSAFFGPIKYSILPQHLEKHELLGGNGLIEMGTFLSVLLGTLFGGIFILADTGRHTVERRDDRPCRHRLADRPPHSASSAAAARAQDQSEHHRARPGA